MTDLNSEQLNGKYKQAYEFAMNDHLQAKQDLDAAKQEIEELRFKLTEQQVKIDAMDAFNKLLEDQSKHPKWSTARGLFISAPNTRSSSTCSAELLEKPLEA